MTDSRRLPDSNGNFGTTRQPNSDTSIRPPALPPSLRQIVSSDAPTIEFVDQRAAGQLQATPRPSMRHSPR
jgi:hypothetical protein